MPDSLHPRSEPKVLIFHTIGLVYRFVWQNRTDFLNLVFLPVLALSVLATLVATTDVDPLEASKFGWTVAALVFVNLYAWTTIAVAWHRRFLLPNERPTYFSQFVWRRRHTRFLLMSVAIFLGVFLTFLIPGIILGLIIGEAAIILAVPAYLVGVRLMLVLPSVAIDQRITLREIWSIGTRNSWRLFAVTILASIPIGLASGFALLILEAAMGNSGTGLGLYVTTFIEEFFSFTTTIIGVSILSSAYLTLDGANLNLPATVPHESEYE
jgi:hypothetical protein